MLASAFHVRNDTERVLNASSDWNEQNVPNVRSNLAANHLIDINNSKQKSTGKYRNLIQLRNQTMQNIAKQNYHGSVAF